MEYMSSFQWYFIILFKYYNITIHTVLDWHKMIGIVWYFRHWHFKLIILISEILNEYKTNYKIEFSYTDIFLENNKNCGNNKKKL